MRNLLALLAAAVLVVGGLGWYLNWFKVQSVTEPLGHRSVNIDINGTKIKQDIHEGETKVQDALNKEEHKNDATTEVKNAAGQIQHEVGVEVKQLDGELDTLTIDPNKPTPRP